MVVAMLLVPWMSLVSALPPEPAAHLTPPQPQQLQKRNDTVVSTDQEPAEEMQQEESRALEWTIPLPRGMNRERCNPCDKEPWVPVARALSLDSQYALSVPAVPINLPISYGIPVTPLKRPSQQYSSPPQGPPSSQYGPPPQGPLTSQYGPPPQGPPSSQYGPPPQGPPSSQYGPPPQGPPTSQYGPPPPQQIAPTNQYGPPTAHNPPSQPQSEPSSQYGSPFGGDARENSQQTPSEQYGLPPPPLPQRFTDPLKTYGPPQPLTQHVSASDPKPQLVSPLNYQQLPHTKNAPLFNSKPLTNSSPHLKKPPTVPTQNYRHLQYMTYRSPVKTPVLVGKPIPFPLMSKVPIPPLFNYQNYHDGNKEELYPYLQPPKQQNVVVTITETEEDCKECNGNSHGNDSEPAPAEPVAHSAHPTQPHPTTTVKSVSLESQKPTVQVLKSVPLAEYLASVEYPMQIIQAPILDVPDLSTYWDLGYHNFPYLPNQQGSSLNKVPDQNQLPSSIHPSDQIAVYVNTNTKGQNGPLEESTNLDDVNLEGHSQTTTNKLPYNHKPSEPTTGKQSETTEKGLTSEYPSQTPAVFLKSTQGSHISKIPPAEPSKQASTDSPQSQETRSSTGHFVTNRPVMTEMQPPRTDAPMSYNSDSVQSSSQELKLTTQSEPLNHSERSKFRFVNPPFLGPDSVSDWSLHTYGRGWGSTPPKPFVMPTAAPHKPRFEVRPSPAPSSKKPKLIQQIIVPYTSSKNPSPSAQEPNNNLAWTPVPPTNQGRKVPNGVDQFIDQFSSTTGIDNSYQHGYPIGGETVPLTATGSDNVGSHHVIPVNNGQPINLPPHIINQILQRNPNTGLVSWPSGPDGLQQVLNTNLQSLLRGEEDSVDFARLQKNIDNWTAEGYKQNSPSVNFIPVTDIAHVYNSKKIPDEYFTATEPTKSGNNSRDEPYQYYQHKPDEDAEGAASQRHQVKISAHTKDDESAEDLVKGLLNNWSLLDTKLASTSEAPDTSSEVPVTSKVWEKVQVSISPLTHEKVYVVTPVSVTEGPEATTSATEPDRHQLQHPTS